MSDQPTPLTDAVVFIQPDLNLQVVDADFARRFERCARMMAEALEYEHNAPDWDEAQSYNMAQEALTAWRELNK